MTDEPITSLDVQGLQCPMPLLKTKRALRDLSPGSQLRVITTDPTSVKDFEVFALHSKHVLLELTEKDGIFVFLIEKRSGT